VTPHELAELRQWAEAHALHGSVQARQVLELLTLTEALQLEVKHLRAVDYAARKELDRMACQQAEKETSG
jgi:hypothetical protein